VLTHSADTPSTSISSLVGLDRVTVVAVTKQQEPCFKYALPAQEKLTEKEASATATALSDSSLAFSSIFVHQISAFRLRSREEHMRAYPSYEIEQVNTILHTQ